MNPKTTALVSALIEGRSLNSEELGLWSEELSPAQEHDLAMQLAPEKTLPPLPVNTALCLNPNLFPGGVGWVDLFHDKGHLSRASLAWMAEFWQNRLDAGASPTELGAWSWAMAISGQNMATNHFSSLLACDPAAARICVDAEPSQIAFAKIAALFEEASTSWAPPKNMELRGWGKMRTDQSIQDASREKFAGLASACHELAKAGLPESLRSLALGRLENPTDDSSWHRQGFRRQSALAFLLKAKASGVSAAELWAGGDSSELMGAACLTHSAKNFRLAVASTADDALSRCETAGKAIAKALAEHGSIELPEGSEPRLVHERALQGRRVSDSIGYFANWAMCAEAAEPGCQEAYLECVVGALFEQKEFAQSADAFIQRCASIPSRSALSIFCISLAQAMQARGIEREFSLLSKQVTWRSHLGQARAADKKASQSKAYALRHLSLSAHYPDPECEAQSIAVASSATAAFIEEAELTKLVPLLVADPSAVDSDDPDGAAPSPMVERPSKKVRL